MMVMKEIFNFISKCKLLCVFLVILLGCSTKDNSTTSKNEIDHAIQRMAKDFVELKPMQGFPYQDITLSEAYYWQGKMAEYLGVEYGGVIGYKTGGHNVGPTFPTFPPDGIRGLLLEKMIFPSNSSVRLDATMRGFLEADLAFRVKDDSINEAQNDLEILAGLDAIIPFAEVPDPYYEDGTRTVFGTVVSNMGSRFSFVGEPVLLEANELWLEKINNFTYAVHDENGVLIEEGKIKGWYEPLKVVYWLRDHLLLSGIRLKAGDLLSLGNIGIIRQLHPNSPRGPAYQSNSFTLSYYGLSDQSVSVTINVDRGD
jgi:2-keto-4-pentenoate hydratase